MRRPLLFGTLASALVLLSGCDFLAQLRGDKADASGSPATSAGPSAVAAAVSAPASASAASAASLAVTFPAREIAAGAAPDGAWLPAFSLSRPEGNDGLTFERAAGRCRERGLELCTETQWARACAVDDLIGTSESWTATAEASGAVVRGGAGCSSRAVAAATSEVPARAALCCTRAIAIRTENPNPTFLASSEQRLLAYESATRARSGDGLRAQLGDSVIFGGQEKTRDELIAAIEGGSPASPTLLDRCQVAIDKTGDDARLVSDCQTSAFAGGALVSEPLRIVHGGPDTRILLVGPASTMPLLDRAKKQRVRELIGGD